MEYTTAITTEAGVVDINQPAGTVTVTRGEGSTMVDLLVSDGDDEALVHLNYHQLVALMVALGAAGAKL